MIFPLFFKTLIEKASNSDIDKYNNYLYDRYSNENSAVKELLSSIKLRQNIPLEILCKYYVRLYTNYCPFSHDLNRDLRLNIKDKHLPFIKILYEGVKLKILPLSNNKELYRGASLTNEEINKIKIYLNKKIDDLPALIVFSKSFLSFTKDKKVAKRFLDKCPHDEVLSKVLFVLEKEEKEGYNLSTHGDIEQISFFTNEKEVLFFPFSSFEIKAIKKIKIEKENIYEIKLLYLGKYLNDIEKNKDIIINENKIPDSEFKKQLTVFGLINPELIQNISIKVLYKIYVKYKIEIFHNNFIIGIINISQKDINKNIQIINSFENVKRENKYKNNDNDWKYENEKDIKENTEIKIEGEKINFSYYHSFDKKGIYEILYIFKKELSKTNHMFYNCDKITNLYLSNFNTQNVTNMSHMFTCCKTLTKLNLSNLNTQNVTNMSYIFSGCNSLNNLNLSNINTQNLIDISGMFYGCDSLTILDLSNFNTKNITNMKEMFYGCKNLTKLNLSNFNTQNVNEISGIFSGCDSLKEKNIIRKIIKA